MHLIIPVFAALFGISIIPTQEQSVELDRRKIEGRWDIIVHSPTGDYPSWLEVQRSGVQSLFGHFVGRTGSSRPVSRVLFDSGVVRFSVPPQWERRTTDLYYEGELKNDRLSGWTTDKDGNRIVWSGMRAPLLRRAREPEWGKPIHLFTGTDLKGWHCIGKNLWRVSENSLTNEDEGGNLVTVRSFDDFKLHVEFRYPKDGNSGVYLRGRYEVQIEDTRGQEPATDHLGAIYGFLAPGVDVAKLYGEWQSFDITLIGRMVTVKLNGKTVICNREIPGITGGALDSDEGAPGPLLLQGDHGPVDFRNVVITPAK